MYSQLTEFVINNGHATVPSGHGRLGEWIEDIRAKNKLGLLNEEQQIALEELGMDIHILTTTQTQENLKKRKEISSNISDDEYKPKFFKNGIDTPPKKVRKYDDTWDMMFDKLRRFKEENGHCLVSRTASDLGLFVQRMRYIKRGRGSLDQHEDKLKKLDELGFVWDCRELIMFSKTWEEMFDQLHSFHKLHGHFNIPKTENELFTWISTMKAARFLNKQRLSDQRIGKLESIGFDFHSKSPKVEKKRKELKVNPQGSAFEELVDYVDEFEIRSVKCEYLNCLAQVCSAEVQKSKEDNIKEVETQPMQVETTYQKMTLRPKVEIPSDFYETVGAEAMEDYLSFMVEAPSKGKKPNEEPSKVWKPASSFDLKWEQMFEELKLFKKTWGHCMVPKSEQLVFWVYDNRKCRRLGMLSEEKVRRLDELGFVWDSKDLTLFSKSWGDMFERLKQFKKENGHLEVPRADDQLHTWICTMRYAYHFGRRGFFDSERIRCMNDIGFDWTIQGVEAMEGKFSDNTKDGDESPQDPGDTDALNHSEDWDSLFEELKKFRDLHGHCIVSSAFPALSNFVNEQRSLWSSGNIDPSRYQRLNSIGFVWRLDDVSMFGKSWEDMYTFIKEGIQSRSIDISKSSDVSIWMNTSRFMFNLTKNEERLRKLALLEFGEKQIEFPQTDSQDKILKNM